MYLLYLDESGDQDNKKEDYFVLGGLCVPETSVSWLTYQLDKLAESIYPDDPRSVEFHAFEIFSGRKSPWNNFRKKEVRIQIIKDTLKILDKAKPDIAAFACAVHKASFHGSPLCQDSCRMN